MGLRILCVLILISTVFGRQNQSTSQQINLFKMGNNTVVSRFLQRPLSLTFQKIEPKEVSLSSVEHCNLTAEFSESLIFRTNFRFPWRFEKSRFYYMYIIYVIALYKLILSIDFGIITICMYIYINF